MRRDLERLGQIVIQNHVAGLPMLMTWLATMQEKFAIDDALLFRLDLVLNEAIPNIIEHAHMVQGMYPIEIRLSRDDQSLQLEIVDSGIAFNMLTHHYMPADTLDDASVSGRGIHLIQHFASQCEYHRHQQQNCLTLRFDPLPA